MNMFGISSLLHFWVAINDNKEVYGTTGLYTYKKDENEAVWLSWFCVDPAQRGKGIGKQLIEYSIDMAKKYNKKYFRLYTSNDPNEQAAQNLYEKYGFKIVKTKKKHVYTEIYRELELSKY